jgi:MFS family permease
MKTTRKTSKVAILLVSSLTIMSVITISPSLPQMNAVFIDHPNAGLMVRLVLTIPALFIALSAGITGIIIDRFARLKLLWIAMVLYALGGTAGFWLTDIYYLLISRAVLGIAAGIQMTIVTTLIADYFVGKERQKLIGIQIAFMSIGGIIFLSLGGLLADFSWRFPFLIYSFSLLILPFAFIYLHEPEHTERQSEQIPKSQSPKIIWLLFINTMAMWVLFFLIPVQLPFYLKEIHISTNLLIGLAIAISTAFSAVSSFFYSSLKERFSFFSIFALGYLLIAIAYVVLSIADNYLLVSISMVLAGFGMGMMIPNTNMFIMKIAPAHIRGREIGRLTTFWFMGQFMAPVILYPISTYFSIGSTFFCAAIILFMFSLAFILLQTFIKNVD